MASLRKPANAPDVTAAPTATAAPSPASPSPPTDTAAHLQAQIDALRQAELAADTNKRRAAWLDATPAAQRRLAELDTFHREAIAAGLADGSPAYFQYLETQLASPNQTRPAEYLVREMQQRAAQTPPPPPPKPERRVMVSAPVSREVIGSRPSGQTSLTAAQREAAKIAGVSEAEYSIQLARLREMQALGEYSDRR